MTWRVRAIFAAIVLMILAVAAFTDAPEAGATVNDPPRPAPSEPETVQQPAAPVDPMLGGTGPGFGLRTELSNPFDICEQKPPTPATPYEGSAGILLPNPMPVASGSIYTTTGVGGYRSFTYDLGCSFDRIEFGTAARTGNALTQMAVFLTAATDSVERQAWSPNWLTDLLAAFGDSVTGEFQGRLWVAVLGVGLLFATVMLLRSAAQGALHAVAGGAAWAVLVVGVVALTLAAPLAIAAYGQGLTATVVQTLHGSDADPATITTERVMRQVHYASWERRTFGNSTSPVVAEQAPRVFGAVTYTFAEQAQAQTGKDAAEALRSAHAEQFTAAYEAVCAADVQACEAMRGLNGKTGVSALELGFSMAANGFRILAALLMVVCTVLLVLYGLVWLVTSPYLVLPAGAGLRVTLLDNTWLALTTALLAVLGSWGFGLWTQMAFSPEVTVGWSLVLLAVGTVLFWTMLRPDRKLLSLATGGRVRGYGKLASLATKFATTYFAAKAGVKAGIVTADEEPDEVQERVEDGRYSAVFPPAPRSAPREPYALSAGGAQPLEGVVIPRDPAVGVEVPSGTAGEPRVVVGEVVPDPYVLQLDAADVYRRDDEPTEFPPTPPPPPGTAAEVYRRQDDLAGVNDDERAQT